MSGQGFRIFLQLISVVVLARLLAPEDFGVLAIALVIVGIGELLRDSGLSNAAIQARTLTVKQRDALFWVNALIGFALAGFMWASAPWLGDIFNSPQLTVVTQWLSLTLIVNALATQYRASLTRGMRFTGLTASEVIAQALALVAAVTAALSGWGVGALVTQQLVAASVSLVIVAALNAWLPRLDFRGVDLRPFFRYGWNLLSAELFIYASKNVDTLVIGMQFGPGPLGVYNRAYQLLMSPIMQVNAPLKRVALPTLAKLQDDRTRYGKFLLRSQKVLMLATVPLLAIACAQAEGVVRLALGDQWGASVPIFQLLAVGGMFQVITYSASWAFLSLGLTGAYFRFTLVVRTLMIGLVIGGAFFGLTGVAAGYSLGLALQWPIAMAWLRGVDGVPVRSILLLGARIVVASAVAAGAGWVASQLLEPSLGDSAWLVGVCGSALVLLILMISIRPLRRDAADVLDVVRRVRRR